MLKIKPQYSPLVHLICQISLKLHQQVFLHIKILTFLHTQA
jgi:hypothetical protein